MFTISSVTARPAKNPPASTTDSCLVAKPNGNNHAPASQLKNVARESASERNGRGNHRGELVDGTEYPHREGRQHGQVRRRDHLVVGGIDSAVRAKPDQRDTAPH